MAEHVHTSVVPHEFDWSSLQVLDRAGIKLEHKIWEDFHTFQQKPVMNRDTGGRVKPNVECDPVEFSISTGKVIWLGRQNFVTIILA